MKDLQLLKNNDNRKWEDKEWVDEFYQFLMGTPPDSIKLGRGHQPKLSKAKAFAIIWYLQEHFPVIPDKIEQCSFCGDLYNTHSEGWYDERKGKSYCASCDIYIQDGHGIRCFKCQECAHEQQKGKRCEECKCTNLEEQYF